MKVIQSKMLQRRARVEEFRDYLKPLKLLKLLKLLKKIIFKNLILNKKFKTFLWVTLVRGVRWSECGVESTSDVK